MPRLSADFYRWWYVSIGAGFLLLAIRAALVGEPTWRIAIRFLIGVGFLVLAVVFKPRRGV